MPSATREPRSSNVRITASDGHVVPATLVHTGSDRIVVMSHGITGDRDEDGVHSEFAGLLAQSGFDSIRFDFRGHGASAMPSEAATVSGQALDFMSVLRWTREQGYRKIFHLATSFGASITLLCAARLTLPALAAVAFWNPVIDYGPTFIDPPSEWARQYFDHKSPDELPFRRNIPIGTGGTLIGPQMAMELLFLQPQETVWPADLPLLIVHGNRDTCAPYESVLAYCRKNPGPVRLHTLDGADHGFGEKIPEAYAVTMEWFLRAG